MENLTSQENVKMNKRNNHQWTPTEDKILIECCLELVNQGWRANNGFKPGYLSQLQKWMAEKIPNCKIMGNPHMNSRMRTFKAQFRELKEIRSQSRFGWDKVNKCITCEDYVWYSWLKSHKEAVGLSNKQFSYFDELAIIFEKDQTTRDEVEFKMSVSSSLKMLAMTPRILHAKEVKGSTKDPTNNSFSKHMERFYDICDEAKQEIGKVATYFQHLNANTVKKTLLYESITKLNGLTKEEIVQAIDKISSDKGQTESFFLFPDDDARSIYVKSVLDGVI
ncbi:Myb/SANT-like domain-containing protein [Dioscorea alata]|uniref:Myb/SANT-like domain-containing protein n=1 Tax=Dioscorea alata TaxID=55571 RepID=A0ACB7WSC8_DIOAL|nr:Myb/SANT-like domain-containing protein [Dioscorea alata]